jgi:hypothetical protein
MIHKNVDRWLFTNKGSVLKTGGAGNLAKGQLAIVSKTEATATGARVISDFAGFPSNKTIEIRLGKFGVSDRARNSKSYSTIPFTINDVIGVSVSAPKITEQIYDSVLIGYDGINPETALTFEEGDNTVLDIVLKGAPIGFYSPETKDYAGVPQYMQKLHFGYPEGTTLTNQEIVEEAVRRAKLDILPRGANKITDLIKIDVVNSEASPVSGVPYVFSTLNVNDMGDSNALADVQSQYPAYKVKVTGRVGNVTEYTILRPQSATLAPFSQSIASYIKGCANCIAGYTELKAGFVYSVQLEDDGVDLKATVQTLPGALPLTAIKIGQVAGLGTYTVVVSTQLTESQKTTFIATNAITSTAIFNFVGKVGAECANGVATTTSWVNGKVCNATTENYKLQLKDDDCTGTRLIELQKAYPSLVITETVTNGGCQRVYQTSVITDLQCTECDEIFLQDVNSIAPLPYNFTNWTKVEAPKSATALMGIRITALPFILDGGETMIDEVPFYETSVEISVAGGYLENYIGSQKNYDKPFNVKRLSRKEDRDHLGYSFRKLEDQSRTYFDNEKRHKMNLYAKAVLGEESVLENRKQYVHYELSIDDSHKAQGNGGRVDTGINYQIVAEVGRHLEVEALINKIAVKAGLAPVQAFGNIA